MRQYLTHHDIFSEVKLVRAAFSGSIFVLEGDTDCTVLDSFVDASKCKTLPAHGKDNVLGTISLAESTGLSGVLGLVDADFDRIRKRVPTSSNVCVTDLHDLDLVIVSSSVFDRLVRQYCDTTRVAALLSVAKKASLLDLFIEAAGEVGYVRYVSHILSCDLNFQVLNFSVFIDRPTMQVIGSDLRAHVVACTKNCRISSGNLAAEVAKVSRANHDPKQMANGHDVIEIMSLALRCGIAKAAAEVTTPSNLEKMLRMGYAASEFMLTGIYRWIKAWEMRNAPYVVLKV